MRRRIVLIQLIILLASGLVSCSTENRGANIPDDVTYTVTDTDILPGIKRSLEVRLNRKVREDVLRAIALELKAQDSRDYERTFITYHLSGMEMEADAWATTHFNPGLQVSILGLTVEQEEGFAREQEDPSRDLVGIWFDERGLASAKITIYRQNGKLYMETKYKDGSISNEEMVEKPSSSGRLFEKKGGSSFGDHCVIDRQGNLQLRNDDGVFSTAKLVK